MSAAAAAHDLFITELPRMKRIAAYSFRHLDPDKREEAVQNTVTLAWKFFSRLCELGRENDPTLFNGVIKFAIRQSKVGRAIQGTCHKRAKDAIQARDFGKVRFESSDVLSGLVSKHDTSIPEIVSFRIDVPKFLSTLTDRQQQMARLLAIGCTTSDVAKQISITPGAVSQFRTRFKKLYDEFFAA